jgi:hypothetical protein
VNTVGTRFVCMEMLRHVPPPFEVATGGWQSGRERTASSCVLYMTDWLDYKRVCESHVAPAGIAT